MQTLSLDTQKLFSDQPNWVGLHSDHRSQLDNPVHDALANVEAELAAGKYGFVEILKDQSILADSTTALSKLDWAKTLVVVGIGGSDLGARVIKEAFADSSNSTARQVLFHGDSTDPAQIQRLLAQINLQETVFVIISKSGETVETISQYLFFKDLYQQQDATTWAQHFLFITDPEKGILRQEAEKFQIPTLAIPPTVGGRFSVLSAVGLLPALAMGVAVEELVQGALDFVQDETSRKLSKQIALSQYLLWQQQLKLIVLMPYSIQLQEFGRWFRQLWAESLGKNGTGIMPIKADGPADQHSQLQFYNQGELLQSFLFIDIAERNSDFQVPDTDISDLTYLSGHSFSKIISAERQATAYSLYKHGRPSATIELTQLTPYSLGQLFMLFELAVVYLGALFNINPFDQPGVEESKQYMYVLLGRTGFEELRTELDQALTKSI